MNNNFNPPGLFAFDLSPNLRIPAASFHEPDVAHSVQVSTKKKLDIVQSIPTPPPPPPAVSKKPSSYTKVIHDLAENPQTDHFISWTKDGRFLHVRDANLLCSELEKGRHFRSSKFASIVRNLNYHCFRKLRFDELDSDLRTELDQESSVDGARHLFYHPCFQKGRPDLLGSIKSQKTAEAEKRNEEKNRTMNMSVLKETGNDILELRLDFARKEAFYNNILAQKDALIAEKDAEILALHALVNKRKREEEPTSEYEAMVKKQIEYKVLDDVDYNSIFDEMGLDVPELTDLSQETYQV
eukprot:CAMPEP_0114359750 /NCGR_PEP_ID=MMETSP0101-20121206/23253_1 /TAXON_ID=38822 ORGANISM="Pteridomonas danica, Strain PT" /NCGR_SAMPLE_ID=MMETSP0101 /ASSEMBLY_ACC=CAM_ASM_000211 /LENGTH=297 /DNA_ID=CAMNT_0001503453 /DNA_START=50 /DNA_END=943 /DNA_ORIENTATION=+